MDFVAKIIDYKPLSPILVSERLSCGAAFRSLLSLSLVSVDLPGVFSEINQNHSPSRAWENFTATFLPLSVTIFFGSLSTT